MRRHIPTVTLALVAGLVFPLATLPGYAAQARAGNNIQSATALAPPARVGAPNPLADTAFVTICSQQPQICPVERDTWEGETDAWQRTAKRWHRHTDTPSGINVVWEWSAPYAGSNPAYADHRENRYDDYTNTPDEYPLVPGPPPVTYDWERWEPGSENYWLHQFGQRSESLSPLVGETDCDSGLYFPLIDHNLGYAYTPMFVERGEACVGGGYIATHRAELWGEPLSPLRVSKCDNNVTGIPAIQSPRGNAVCKISPYVGLAYTRYVQGAGPTPEDAALVGCEATVYAWGWTKPEQTHCTGQDYQEWFRNGMLRFSKWLNLSAQVSEIPAPDDHAWWNARCEQAWSGMTNWLFSGKYKIGLTVFTDTVTLPPIVAAEIPISGSSLTSTIDSIVYAFPSNTFTDTAIVSHTIRFQSDHMPPGNLRGVNRFYEVAAAYIDTKKPAHPTRPYTVTVRYTAAAASPLVETTLALYSWDGSRWAKEPTSTVFTVTNTVVATPDHFSLWAVLGETRQVFLPLITRHGP